MNEQDVRPSAWWFALPVVVAATGLATFAFLLVNGLTGLTDGFTQVVVPGRAEVTLAEPGTYAVFYEYRSVVGNRVYSTQAQMPGLQCRLVSKATGVEIPLSPSSMSMTYELGGRCGAAVFECEITAPGVHEFSAGYPEGESGPDVVLVIGRGFVKKLLFTIFGGIGTFFGSFIAAGLITLLIFLKRRKAKAQATDLVAGNT